MSYVLHVDGRAIDGFNRKIVQFRDGLRASVHLHVVFERAKLRCAGGKDEVLRIHGVDDVDGGKTFCLESGGINIDADDALLAPVREGRGGARHGGQLRADKVISGVEKLLFAERVASQANLDNRHGRS